MLYGMAGLSALILAAALVTATATKDRDTSPVGEGTALATFAGGCFWCMEPPFRKLEGVEAVVSGYTGGDVENPTYEEVCRGNTGHLEAVQVAYDPDKIGYDDLLRVFWRQIDPTDPGGQFADRGSHYRTAVFYHDEQQRLLAEQSKSALAASGRFSKPLVTEIRAAQTFWPAEDYHQGYHARNPVRYQLYRAGSGRAAFLKETWKEDDAMMKEAGVDCCSITTENELRSRLSPLQFQVTRRDGTEPPFRNEYWDNHREGIYVDIISGEPLFSSRDKYDSGTGWPSFTRPLSDGAVVEREDRSHGMVRREVRGVRSDSHLGHVFPDGPEPTGLRYCMNSAALRFIPLEDLETEGYGEYRRLFESD